MRGFLALLTFSAVAAAPLAQAQTVTPPSPNGYFTHAYQAPFTGAAMEEPSFSRPLTSANHERTMSELRQRVATGLVRKGRCIEAARYAERQNDTMLAKRVRATCAAYGIKG